MLLTALPQDRPCPLGISHRLPCECADVTCAAPDHRAAVRTRCRGRQLPASWSSTAGVLASRSCRDRCSQAATKNGRAAATSSPPASQPLAAPQHRGVVEREATLDLPGPNPIGPSIARTHYSLARSPRWIIRDPVARWCGGDSWSVMRRLLLVGALLDGPADGSWDCCHSLRRGDELLGRDL
jgi:hypothetical protein